MDGSVESQPSIALPATARVAPRRSRRAASTKATTAATALTPGRQRFVLLLFAHHFPFSETRTTSAIQQLGPRLSVKNGFWRKCPRGRGILQSHQPKRQVWGRERSVHFEYPNCSTGNSSNDRSKASPTPSATSGASAVTIQTPPQAALKSRNRTGAELKPLLHKAT